MYVQCMCMLYTLHTYKLYTIHNSILFTSCIYIYIYRSSYSVGLGAIHLYHEMGLRGMYILQIIVYYVYVIGFVTWYYSYTYMHLYYVTCAKSKLWILLSSIYTYSTLCEYYTICILYRNITYFSEVHITNIYILVIYTSHRL